MNAIKNTPSDDTLSVRFTSAGPRDGVLLVLMHILSAADCSWMPDSKRRGGLFLNTCMNFYTSATLCFIKVRREKNTIVIFG